MAVERTTSPQLILKIVSTDGDHGIGELYVLYRPAPAEDDGGVFSFMSADDDEPIEWDLGVTDACGYMGDLPTVGPTAGAPKLARDEPYEMYFVRHPDPQLAISMWEELNGLAPVKLTRDWPPPRVITPSVRVPFPHDPRTPSPDPEGAALTELIVELPSTPSTYLPEGPARYDGWILYKGMPHAWVPEVIEAVARAQHDLGKLRYPVGGQDGPYEPEPGGEHAHRPNRGKFDARLLNAVLALQRDTLAGAAFKVRDKSKAHDRASGSTLREASWEYLHPHADPPVVTAPVPRATERELRGDGVIDAITGRAIEAWLDGGLRKKGHILVALLSDGDSGWITWLREDAAYSLVAWRELVRALGFAHGIAANHTYRSPMKDIGQAAWNASPVSNHKTGLAIDVRMAGFQPYYERMPNHGAPWPVYYLREKTDTNSQGYKAHWRVYAGSTLAGVRDEAAGQIRSALEPHAQKDGILADAARALLDELALPDVFFVKYFAEQITPWEYDDYHEDGGVPGQPIDPPSPSTRFVDLTALAAHCHLRPIRSLTNKDVATRKDWGRVRGSVKPNTIARVKLLGANLAKSQRESNHDLEIVVDGATLSHKALDAAFIGAYGEALERIVSTRATSGAYAITGSKLTVKLSKSLAARVEKIAAELEKLIGRLASLEPSGEGDVDTCEGWATRLREMIERLSTPSTSSDGEASSTARPPSQVVLVPVVAETAEGVPVRLLPEEIVFYPTPGDPGGLEWWHFQRTDIVRAAKTFGPLLRELGWVDEALLNKPMLCTYDRVGVGYPQSELDREVG